jgi:hypothetical protein
MTKTIQEYELKIERQKARILSLRGKLATANRETDQALLERDEARAERD